jgi:hypothetical protein
MQHDDSNFDLAALRADQRTFYGVEPAKLGCAIELGLDPGGCGADREFQDGGLFLGETELDEELALVVFCARPQEIIELRGGDSEIRGDFHANNSPF